MDTYRYRYCRYGDHGEEEHETLDAAVSRARHDLEYVEAFPLAIEYRGTVLRDFVEEFEKSGMLPLG